MPDAAMRDQVVIKLPNCSHAAAEVTRSNAVINYEQVTFR